MSERHKPLPLTFRSELLQRVMPALIGGECCSLVGVSGVGKTNLVRFIQRPDVQTLYWGDESVWVIPIDTNGLVFSASPDEYAVLELMIDRLIREALQRHAPSDVVNSFESLQLNLTAQPSARLALRYLDRICGTLRNDLHAHLIFVFDQFEDIWKSFDARMFLNLRYLRDEYKYQLAYLVVTRERLPRMRQRGKQNLQADEAFWELFASHTYGLGMYSEQDAITMFERITARHAISVSPAYQEAVLSLSGRHPALLRAVMWELYDTYKENDTPANLVQAERIAEECAKLWHDLFPEEQQIVRAIGAGRHQPANDSAAQADLRLKEVIVSEPPRLFSPLFAAYAVQQGGATQDGIVVDLNFRQVWFDDRLLPESLAPLEFSLLEHLARNVGKICRREDLLRALYQDDALDANDERLDTVLRRLREALGEDARSPRYIFTHRGVGLQLTKGGIRE